MKKEFLELLAPMNYNLAGMMHVKFSLLVFSGIPVAQSLVFCVVFCRSLFVSFSPLFSPLYCLPFFDLRLLITPLVSSDYPFGILKSYLMSLSQKFYIRHH